MVFNKLITFLTYLAALLIFASSSEYDSVESVLQEQNVKKSQIFNCDEVHLNTIIAIENSIEEDYKSAKYLCPDKSALKHPIFFPNNLQNGFHNNKFTVPVELFSRPPPIA